LPQSPFVLPTTSTAEASAGFGLGFIAFIVVCLASTVGPFLLAILARTQH